MFLKLAMGAKQTHFVVGIQPRATTVWPAF